MTDEEIIHLFSTRSEEAIPALQAQYGAYCAAIARQFLSDTRDVEECLSDCWLSVWHAIPPTYPDHFKGWLGAIVRHRALAIGRQNDRRPATVDEAVLELASCLPQPSDAHAEAEAAELGQAISQFLYTKKSNIRIAFLRRYWYTDTVEQVAAHMGWSISKTKSVLFRARNELRNYLYKEGLL